MSVCSAINAVNPANVYRERFGHMKENSYPGLQDHFTEAILIFYPNNNNNNKAITPKSKKFFDQTAFRS